MTDSKKAKIAHTQLFINAQFVNSVSGATFPTVDPHTGLLSNSQQRPRPLCAGEVICQVSEAGKADVDLAVKAARAAFESTAAGSWKAIGPSGRARLLFKLADLIEQHAKELGALEVLTAAHANLTILCWQALDAGKTVGIAIGADVTSLVAVLRYYAGCERLFGLRARFSSGIYAWQGRQKSRANCCRSTDRSQVRCCCLCPKPNVLSCALQRTLDTSQSALSARLFLGTCESCSFPYRACSRKYCSPLMMASWKLGPALAAGGRALQLHARQY